jgi:hypothetical protein
MEQVAMELSPREETQGEKISLMPSRQDDWRYRATFREAFLGEYQHNLCHTTCAYEEIRYFVFIYRLFTTLPMMRVP